MHWVAEITFYDDPDNPSLFGPFETRDAAMNWARLMQFTDNVAAIRVKYINPL